MMNDSIFYDALYKLLSEYLVPDMIRVILSNLDPISKLMVLYIYGINFSASRLVIIRHLRYHPFDYNGNIEIVKYLKRKDVWNRKLLIFYLNEYDNLLSTDMTTKRIVTFFIHNPDVNNLEILLRLAMEDIEFIGIMHQTRLEQKLFIPYMKLVTSIYQVESSKSLEY